MHRPGSKDHIFKWLKLSVFGIVLFLSTLLVCSFLLHLIVQNAPFPSSGSRPGYYEGSITVVFVENTTYCEGDDVVREYNLTGSHYTCRTYDGVRRLRIVVNVPGGEEKAYRDLFLEDERIADAELRYRDLNKWRL